MNAESLLTAFAIGLLGSTHCLAMCGGIAGALGMRRGLSAGAIASDAAGSWNPIIVMDTLGWAVGRIGTYALLGLVLGMAAQSMVALAPVLAPVLRTLAGLVMILMGIHITGLWQPLARLEQAGARLWRSLAPTPAADARAHPVLIGALWGMLPCGLVYSTLAWSAASGSSLQSAANMFAFGLGTVPAVAASSILFGQVAQALRRRSVRLGAGLIVVALGLWTLGGMEAMRTMHGDARMTTGASVDAGQPSPASPTHTHHVNRGGSSAASR